MSKIAVAKTNQACVISSSFSSSAISLEYEFGFTQIFRVVQDGHENGRKEDDAA